MKRIVCKYCGTEHACAGRMSNHERAKFAARVRALMVSDGDDYTHLDKLVARKMLKKGDK